HFPSSTPRPPPSTLFPYTTLFRSRVRRVDPGRVEYEVEISFHTRSQLHDVTELVKTEDVLTHRPYRAALIRRGGRRIGDEDPHSPTSSNIRPSTLSESKCFSAIPRAAAECAS